VNRLVFLTPSSAHPGFALAGAVHEVAAPGQAEAVLRRLLAEADTAVVAVDERLLAEIPEERLRFLERSSRAQLLVLPAPLGGEEEEDYIQRLLRRVLGYRVKVAP
jgi:V/A-type H+-transporting ATPase subunit F